MDYQKLIVAGNATGDAQRRTSKKGDVTYTTFGVGVSDGANRPTFFPVAVFGKEGEALASRVTKGCPVLVEGRVEVSPGGRFNVVAERVRLGPARAEQAKPAAPPPAAK
jgi:single-stranded DNA-binding protein